MTVSLLDDVSPFSVSLVGGDLCVDLSTLILLEVLVLLLGLLSDAEELRLALSSCFLSRDGEVSCLLF